MCSCPITSMFAPLVMIQVSCRPFIHVSIFTLLLCILYGWCNTKQCLWKFTLFRSSVFCVSTLNVWGLAMSCVEAVAVFWCTLKFPSSGCTMWKGYVASYTCLAVWVRVELWGSVFLLGDGPFPLDITSPFPHLHHPYLRCGQLQQVTQWKWQPELHFMSSQTTNGLLAVKWTWSKNSKDSWQWTCEMLNVKCLLWDTLNDLQNNNNM